MEVEPLERADKEVPARDEAFLNALDPIFFPVTSASEQKRINIYRARYQEFRQGKAFGAKGELTQDALIKRKSTSWTQPPFITKLRKMVDFNANDRFVRWNQAGDAILVQNPQQFSVEVLPKYFKHSNFPSFLRQLNMYHFTTSRQGPNWREFRNPNFKKGRVDLQRLIKRRPSSSSSSYRNAAAKRKEAAASAAAAAEQSKHQAASFKLGVAKDVEALSLALKASQAHCAALGAYVQQLSNVVQSQSARLYRLEEAIDSSHASGALKAMYSTSATTVDSGSNDTGGLVESGSVDSLPDATFLNDIIHPLPPMATTTVAALNATNSKIAANHMVQALESRRGRKRTVASTGVNNNGGSVSSSQQRRRVVPIQPPVNKTLQSAPVSSLQNENITLVDEALRSSNSGVTVVGDPSSTFDVETEAQDTLQSYGGSVLGGDDYSYWP